MDGHADTAELTDMDAIDQLDSFHLDVDVVGAAVEDGEHDVGVGVGIAEAHVTGGGDDFLQSVAAAVAPPLPSHDAGLVGQDNAAAPTVASSASAAPEPQAQERNQSQHKDASAPSSTYKPYPIGTTLLMSQAEDTSWLTPYLCLLRSQLEVFSATPEEIAAKLSTGGNKVPPIPGQVGIRCVHCKALDYKQRAKSSESFPSCIKNVHQAVRNYQRHHYPKCQAIPAQVRTEVESIKSAKKAQKSRGSAGTYWMASCVRDLHMVDGKDGRAGIFFVGTEHAGPMPDVSHILGGEKTGGPVLDVTSSGGGGGGSGETKTKKSDGGGGGKKKTKAPKIKKAIKKMLGKDSSASAAVANATTAMSSSAQVDPVSADSSGMLNRNDMPDMFNGTSTLTPPPSSMMAMSTITTQMPAPIEMAVGSGMVSVGQNPAGTVAAPSVSGGFQVDTVDGQGRRASFPAGGSEFPIEMFEPRPLREDGRGFVDESANDPAASAYFAAHQSMAQPQQSVMPEAAGGNTGDALANDHFQTEYGFMGINDVVKGHEAEKRKASYRDRRSSWTSRESHGSSTFLSSGSKRGLSDDGDSVGTNEYEPPRRRPSLQSSIGGDLDDFGALDLDNDDDFNDDFGMGIGATGHLPEQLSLSAQTQTVMAGASNVAAAFSGGLTSTSQEVATIGGDCEIGTGNVHAGADPSLDKALQILDEAITVDPAAAMGVAASASSAPANV